MSKLNGTSTANSFSMLSMAIFADSVIDLVNNRLSPQERDKVIVKIDKFIEDIEAGTRIIHSGKLEDRAMESVQAYEFTMDLLSPMEGNDQASKIKNLKKDAKYLSSVEKVDPHKVNTLFTYFERLRLKALSSMNTPILA